MIVFDFIHWLIGLFFVASMVLAGFDYFAGAKKTRLLWPWLMLFSGSFLAVYVLFSLEDGAKPSLPANSAVPEENITEKRLGETPEKIPAVPTTEHSPPAAKTVPEGGILLYVPFTPQAPFGNWADPRQEDGCEETTALMALRWAQWQGLTAEEAEREIIAISDYELAKYGEFRETSIQDTAERILRGYFNFENFDVRFGIDAENIKQELEQGNIAIVAVNGQLLGNPYYTPPGPRDHMIVVHGFDPQTREFIVNDPGTKRGENFRYSESVLEAALQDYPSGNHEPITEIIRAMIVVRR